MTAAEEGRTLPDRHARAAGASLSPSEFADLFQDSARSLWCVAVGVLGNRSLADDVLQEAALIGLTKLDSFEKGTSFTAWMARIVHNVARNHRRRSRRQNATDPVALDSAVAASPPDASRPSPDGALSGERSPFDDEVLRALRELDETARICLLLRTLHAMPYREISRTLDIPEGTAMSHVHRSRQTLRKRLEHRNPDTSSVRTNPK